MKELIKKFVDLIEKGQIEIYNEFSLQHELGIFLRRHFQAYKVQFERNISFFFHDKRNFTKREIDISVFSPDKNQLFYLFELKYPRNGQYPEQMFSFCKDLAFVEEMKTSGFRKTYVLIFADDRLFYEGTQDGIYGYFRAGKKLHGSIKKPTGKKDSEVVIKGNYTVNWQTVKGELKYTLIEANNGSKKVDEE
jgi:hypothetical protein